MSISLLVGKGVLAYAVLRLAVHLVGLRQTAQSTLLELCIVNSLALLLGLAALWPNFSLAAVTVIYALWLLLFSVEKYVLLRSRRWRQSVLGDPTVLVYRGKLLEHNLHRQRLSSEQLLSKLRGHNIFRLSDVEMAVLEPDGLLSVLRTPQAEPVTRQDLLVAGRQGSLPVELIIDGEIVQENLQQQGLTEKWLRDHLRAFGVQLVSEVALATVDDNQELYVDLYDDGLRGRRDLHALSDDSSMQGFAGVDGLQEKPRSAWERMLAERKLRQTEQDAKPHVPKKK